MKSLGDIGIGESLCFVVAAFALTLSFGVLPAVGLMALGLFVRMK